MTFSCVHTTAKLGSPFSDHDTQYEVKTHAQELSEAKHAEVDDANNDGLP